MKRIALLAAGTKPSGYRADPAYTYRCDNLGHALRAMSIDVDCAHAYAWRWRDDVDCVVVHRPRIGLRLSRLLKQLRRSGTKLVADIDDLVFDPTYAGFSPAVLNGKAGLGRIRRRFQQHRSAIEWFDHVTVSTDELSEHVGRCFPAKPVTVLYNGVHWHWRQMQRGPSDSRAAGRVITYLAGTPSHDRDFALIARPLCRFLRAHSDIRLRVTGPLAFELDVPSRQVERGDRVPFASYADQFRDAWVNLAPLEDTPFNACKSALKSLEAGFWGVPTICSPNRDNARFAGAGALLARDEEQWLHWLETLLDDACYRELTGALRTRTMQLADVNGIAGKFVDEVVALAVGRGAS